MLIWQLILVWAIQNQCNRGRLGIFDQRLYDLQLTSRKLRKPVQIKIGVRQILLLQILHQKRVNLTDILIVAQSLHEFAIHQKNNFKLSLPDII